MRYWSSMEPSQNTAEIISSFEVNRQVNETSNVSGISTNIEMPSEDAGNIPFEINENSDVSESETTNSSDTEDYPVNTDLIKDNFAHLDEPDLLTEDFDGQNNIAVKTEIDTEYSIVESNADHVLEIFPFVCGVCCLKFNNISTYLRHFQVHDHVDKYLHVCLEKDMGQEMENSDLFYCGVCRLRYPSLCTLYKHLMEDESVQDFWFNGSTRTAYFYFDQSKSEQSSPDVENTNKLVNKCSKECRHNTVGSQGTVLVCHNKEVDRVVETKHLLVRERTTSRRMMSKIKQYKHRESNKSKEDRDIFREAEEAIRNTGGDKQKTLKCYSKDETREKVSKNRQKGRLTGTDFPCETCGKMLKYGSLQGHRATHEKHIFPCDLCDLKFQSKAWMQTHRSQVHATDKKFTCDECGKSFKALSYLRQHSQTHRKERNIQCPVCAKTFLYKNVLRIHLLTHSENRPHHCNICGKGFKRQHDILVHKEGVHEAVEKYPCTDCDKKFTTKDRLRKHRLIHLPPKFFCQFCEKSFVRKSYLRIHLKVHGQTAV
ncbi:zinc finger protein 429-like [Mercenaria mercenaria]|uniref:zinc finger protein 429-like n=1 Tax=Mercenaria mercenaria TaxID=6596 RepID=UPI00234F1AF2|nr:zinc finger protein 429-like [Mercenaria mercenaria]